MARNHWQLLTTIAAIFLCVTVQQAAYGWSLFDPKNYNECVLEKIKDANNSAAVAAVKQSCRELFPLKRVVLPPVAMKNIAVSDYDVTDQGFEVTLHNNNHDWTITNFLIIAAESGGKSGTLRHSQIAPPIGTVGTVFEMENVITSYGKLTVYLALDPSKAYNFWLSGVEGHH